MKKLLAILMTAFLITASLVGCGSETKEEQTDEGNQKPKEQVVRHNLNSDPETIDPALNAAVGGGTIIQNTFEGLMRLDENNKAIYGIAKEYEISEDGLTYTFHLRDAKWSDGEKVKAQDFEYAWKRALNPKTAADYAYMLYYIKNGEAFNANEISEDQVGVKAVDENTLEVVLEAPTPYFLELAAFPTYMPIRKDIIDEYKDQWALNPETHISNGPFKVTKWAHNDEMILSKNENYYDKDRVKLDRVEFFFITEQSTSLTTFETSGVDVLEDVPVSEIKRLKEETDEFKILPELGTYFYVFNVNKKPMDDVRVRKALTLAIDRRALVDIVTQAEQTPATGFVPPNVLMPDGRDFRDVGGDYYIEERANIEEAKKLLAEAGYQDSNNWPEVTLIYNTSENHKKVAEAIVEMWKQNLGIEITLQNQEWKVFQESRDSGDFVIARHGWLGDYVDPMTFLDMWISNSGNNNAHWKNEEFDNLIKEAKNSVDKEKRYDAMLRAEALMMEDCITLPIYYYTRPAMIKNNIKGIKRSILGFWFYDEAYVE